MLTIPRLLMCVGLLCFVPLLIPVQQRNVIPNGTEERLTLGLPHSPWFVHTSTNTVIETRANGITSSSMNMAFKNTVEFISGSSLLLVLGIALICGSTWLKKRRASSR